MKKICIFILVCFVAGAVVFAEESKLIDFTTINGENTGVEFSENVLGNFSDGERVNLETSALSLDIDNWEVNLNSSASTVSSDAASRTALVTVNGGIYAGDTVLGARVFFPVEPFNAWALIEPPFDIPSYSGADGTKYDGIGVLKNVAAIKEIHMNVYGLNYPHTVSVVLKDNENAQREYVVGNLEYEGWRQLTWRNPAYIEDIRNRELRVLPSYPNLLPLIKLSGMRVYRDSSHVGGNFITYIRDITVVYDLAAIDVQRDIDDETIWNILEDRQTAREEIQGGRLAEEALLRALEVQLQDVQAQ